MKFLPIFLTLLFVLNCTSQDFKKFKIQDIVGPYTLPKAVQDFAAMPENQLLKTKNMLKRKFVAANGAALLSF